MCDEILDVGDHIILTGDNDVHYKKGDTGVVVEISPCHAIGVDGVWIKIKMDRDGGTHIFLYRFNRIRKILQSE